MSIKSLVFIVLILAGNISILRSTAFGQFYPNQQMEHFFDGNGSVRPEDCNDLGGAYFTCLRQAYVAAQKGGEELRGVYASGGILKLIGNKCVAPTAVFESHEARNGLDYSRGARNEIVTEDFRGQLPLCARGLFKFGPSIYKVSGAKILAMCPQMKPCS